MRLRFRFPDESSEQRRCAETLINHCDPAACRLRMCNKLIQLLSDLEAETQAECCGDQTTSETNMRHGQVQLSVAWKWLDVRDKRM